MTEKYSRIADFFRKVKNIDISVYDELFLDKSIHKRLVDTHSRSVDEYTLLLEKDMDECKNFIDSMMISYSEFFRNPLTYAVLEKIILPSIFQKKKTGRREIRVWSAACAGGQEAYSIAMLLEELKSNISEEINYRIFATDQTESIMKDAAMGSYSEDALNNICINRVHRWFTRSGDRFIVRDELKRNIDFSVFNLLGKELASPQASIFGDFDLVFCANLLFYYRYGYRRLILDKAANSLTAGGYLVTGETEREIVMNFSFQEVYQMSGIFSLIGSGRENK